MKKLDWLEKLIMLCLLTGHIENEKPVSLLIIAKPESGKTEILEKFRSNKGVFCPTDVTSTGILHLLHKIKNGEIKHIIIPDLIKPLSRGRSAVLNFISAMNALIEEGYGDVAIYGFSHTLEENGKKIRCGLITAITDEEFNDNRHKWTGLGFISRCLPITYKYDKKMQDEILESITLQEYHKDSPIKLTFPEKPVDIKLNPELAKKIKFDVRVIAVANKRYGFRLQKQMQTMLKAHALMNKREEVIEEDVKAIRDLLYFTNFNYNDIKE